MSRFDLRQSNGERHKAVDEPPLMDKAAAKEAVSLAFSRLCAALEAAPPPMRERMVMKLVAELISKHAVPQEEGMQRSVGAKVL